MQQVSVTCYRKRCYAYRTQVWAWVIGNRPPVLYGKRQLGPGAGLRVRPVTGYQARVWTWTWAQPTKFLCFEDTGRG